MQTPDDDALAALIRREATRHVPPPGLAERIARDVRAQAAPQGLAQPAAGPSRAGVPRWRRGLEALALFGAGATTAWMVSIMMLVPNAPGGIGDEVAASHVRSLMASHLTDVASTDRHTVKPWFAGKLDFAPPVHDLAAEGFALTGGRLDVVAGRPVAALVYQERQHVINLFVWPAQSSPDSATSTQARQGYNLVSWAQQGMQFWAVSDASAPELSRFTAALRERNGSTAAR